MPENGAKLRSDNHPAIMRPPFGQVAQLVEQRIENPRVGGSIPPLATKIQAKRKLAAWDDTFRMAIMDIKPIHGN
jgi:hypothetical protein